MAGYDVATLALQVDSAGFVSGMGQAELALGHFGQGTTVAQRQLGGMDGALTSVLGKLRQYASFAGFAVTSAAMALMSKRAVELASRYETLGMVLRTVGGNIGWSATRLDALATSLRETGISMTESRQQITRMIQANMDLANATKLARIAQDAAVIGNMNSSEAFSALIHGVTTGRTEIMRTLGIQVNFNEAMQDMAKSLKKGSILALTEQEKQQARVNAVMKAAIPIAGSYEAAMETAGKQINSAKRYLEDLMVKVGNVFLPIYTKGVFAYADGLQRLQDQATLVSTALMALVARGLQPLLLRLGSVIIAQGTAILGSTSLATRELEQARASDLAAQAAVREALALQTLAQSRVAASAAPIMMGGLVIEEASAEATAHLANTNLQLAASQAAATASSTRLTAAYAGTTLAARAAAVATSLLGKAMTFLQANAITIVLTGLAYLWARHRAEVMKAEEAYNSVEGAAEKLRAMQVEWGKQLASLKIKVPDDFRTKLDLALETAKQKVIAEMKAIKGEMVVDAQGQETWRPGSLARSGASKAVMEEAKKMTAAYEDGDLSLSDYRRSLMALVVAYPKAEAALRELIKATQTLNSLQDPAGPRVTAEWWNAAAASVALYTAQLKLLDTGSKEFLDTQVRLKILLQFMGKVAQQPFLTTPPKEKNDQIEAAKKAYHELVAEMERARDQQEQLSTALQSGLDAHRQVEQALSIENAALTQAKTQWEAYTKTLGEGKGNTQTFTEALESQNPILLKMLMTLREAGNATQVYEKALGVAKAALDELNTSIEQYANYAAAQREINALMTGGIVAHGRVVKELALEQKAIELGAAAWVKYQAQSDDVTVKAMSLAVAFHAGNAAAVELVSGLTSAASALASLSGVLEMAQQREAIKLLMADTEKQIEQQTRLRMGAATGTVSHEEMVDAIALENELLTVIEKVGAGMGIVGALAKAWAMEQVKNLHQVTKSYQDLLKEAEKEKNLAEERRKASLEPWISALRSLQDMFAKTFLDIFNGGKKGFQGFADAVIAIFKQMLAQLAALFVVKSLGIDKLLEKVSGIGSAAGKSAAGTSLVTAGIGALGDINNVANASFGTASNLNNIANASVGAAGAASAGMGAIPIIGIAAMGVTAIIGGIIGMHKKAEEEARKLREARAAWERSLADWEVSLTGNDLEKAVAQTRSKFDALAPDAAKRMGVEFGGGGIQAWSDQQVEEWLQEKEKMMKDMGLSSTDLKALRRAWETYKVALQQATQEAANALHAAQRDLLSRKMTLAGDDAGAAQNQLAIKQWQERIELEKRFGTLGEDNKMHLDAYTESLLVEVQLLEQAKLARDLEAAAIRKASEELAKWADIQKRGSSLAARGISKNEEGVWVKKPLTETEAITAQAKAGIDAATESYRAQMEEAKALVASGDMTAEMFAALADVLSGELVGAIADVAEQTRLAMLAIARRGEDLQTRLMAATGDTYGAQARAFGLGQQREMEDAITAGWEPAQLAILAAAQALEAAAFAAQQAFEKQQQVANFNMDVGQARLQGMKPGSAEYIKQSTDLFSGQLQTGIAQKIFDYQKLVDAGLITQQELDNFATLLRDNASKAVADFAYAATGAATGITDAVANLISSTSNMAMTAMGIWGATAEDKMGYSQSLLMTDPKFASIIGSKTGVEAGTAISGWLKTNFPDAKTLSGMSEVDRSSWNNFLTAVQPFMTSVTNFTQWQAQQEQGGVAGATSKAARKTQFSYSEAGVGVLQRLDALQTTANMYLREIAGNTAAMVGGFTFGGTSSMRLDVYVHGATEADLAIGDQIAAKVVDRGLSKRATISTSSKGAYKPL